MTPALERLATLWISRRAVPDLEAVRAAAGLDPLVVITGGGSGIGLALARRWVAEGHHVALIGRSEVRLAAALASLNAGHDGPASALALDITVPEAAEQLAGWLAARRAYCDVLVNNAGMGLAGPFTVQDPADFDRLIAMNISAGVRLTRAFLPGMVARGRGGVLTIASLAGVIPGPWQAAYYASKAFIVSLSEAIAEETEGQGVRVTVVLPGPVETAFHTHMGAESAFYRRLLVQGSADEVARLALRGYRCGRRVVAPGLIATLAAWSLRLLPHSLTVPFMNWLLVLRDGASDQGQP